VSSTTPESRLAEPKRYRTRSVTTSATQWFPGRDVPGVRIDDTRCAACGTCMVGTGERRKCPNCGGAVGGCPVGILIDGSEYAMQPGDWIVGPARIACDAATFEQAYEPVPDAACDPATILRLVEENGRLREAPRKLAASAYRGRWQTSPVGQVDYIGINLAVWAEFLDALPHPTPEEPANGNG
jgi:Fe-S-cluster-containing hydrogenase component 2